jgi:protein TonB
MVLSTRWAYCAFLSLSICLLTTKTALAQKERETRYERGTLTKGQKTGVWEYFGYTPSGEKVVVQRYDYDRGRLLYFRPGPDMM